MSRSRDERDRRKAERAEAEAQAARAAAAKSRLQLAVGGFVALAAIIVAVLVFRGASPTTTGTPVEPVAGVTLPPQRVTNLPAAARLAGCALNTYPSEGRTHTTKPVIYKTNPPTSGNHDPVWSQDGFYPAAKTPPIEMLVHTLEHGRIDIQFRPGTAQATIDELETLGAEKLGFGKVGYHVLVFQNPTGMPAAVAATAWTHSLTCPRMTPGVYDAVRAFREKFTDKGPETVP